MGGGAVRLLTFSEMCQMPHGTIYQRFDPCYLGELEIWLGGHLSANAYGYQPLGAEVGDLGQSQGGPDTGFEAYWPAFSASTGGGMVDPETRFLVYEAEDVARLRAALDNPVALNDIDEPLAKVQVPF